jgi:hypothetical protein
MNPMNPVSGVRRQACIALLVFVLGACSARPGTQVVAQAAHGAVNDAWTTMSWEERHDTMTFEVLPTMAPMFQRFEGASAPSMTCRTCHGADAEKVGYAMPRGLPPLDPRNMPRADSSNPKEARIVKFMTDEVTPGMAEVLGVRPYDPKTQTGFGCFGCHTSKAGGS